MLYIRYDTWPFRLTWCSQLSFYLLLAWKYKSDLDRRFSTESPVRGRWKSVIQNTETCHVDKTPWKQNDPIIAMGCMWMPVTLKTNFPRCLLEFELVSFLGQAFAKTQDWTVEHPIHIKSCITGHFETLSSNLLTKHQWHRPFQHWNQTYCRCVKSSGFQKQWNWPSCLFRMRIPYSAIIYNAHIILYNELYLRLWIFWPDDHSRNRLDVRYSSK